jgi:cephalosporin-C deacetylase-like acetyl esterase
LKLSALFAAAPQVFSQSPQPGLPPAVHGLLEEEAAAILQQAEQELSSKEKWEPVRRKRRDELRDMLGLDPLPSRTPLRVRITGKLDQGDHVVEKLAYESVPGFYVSANLYLPRSAAGPSPAIVYVCGHSVVPQGAKTAYQRHGISFARNGYVCLILDPIQIAEVTGLHHGVHGLEMYDWYSRGYAPAGVEVWNAMRAIDYLETRSEVDRARIGMTGRSGGAAMSWFTAAIDERIKVAAPIMGNSTYLANLKENTQSRHCDCMFPLNFHRQEMAHQGALIAPRPLLMAHGRKDLLFPVSGYTKCEELLRKLYDSYGHPGGFRNIVVETGHEDSDFLRESVLRWMDVHLAGKGERPLDMRYVNAPADSLTVFSGKPPAGAVNPRIHLSFRPAASPTAPVSREAWNRRKAELQGLLKSKVFAAFPNVGPQELPGGGERVRFLTERQLTIEARLRAPAGEAKLPLLLYLVPPGENPQATAAFLNHAGGGTGFTQAHLYARDWTPRPISSTEKRDYYRNAMHVGRTPDSMRVRDVMRAAAALASHSRVDAARIVVLGKESDAGVVLYAALNEPRITDVVLVRPTVSHWQGPVFLNVLRYTDLPEAAGLLAPRRLWFFHRMPAEYEMTRRIYQLSGAGPAIGDCYRISELLA